MYNITDLKAYQCKFPLTDGSPHFFCGEATQSEDISEPYCPAHKRICHRGAGKDARALEAMIYAVDKSQYRGKAPYADHTDPIDEELRRGAAAQPERFA